MRMIHLKEEGLEVVGHVRDGDEEQGGDVHCEDGAQQSPWWRSYHFKCLQPMNRLLFLSKKPSQDNLNFNVASRGETHVGLPAD